MPSLSSTPVGDTLDFGFDYPPGYELEFTEGEIISIQDRYLEEQLKLLSDKRASSESRKDAINWLTTPLVKGEQVAGLALLSFQRCCYAYGVDPAEVQERTMRIVAPHLLSAFGYE